MAKELIKVNENWSVTRCVKEMRSQASEVTRVHSVYVVDNDDILLGRLSLKDLLVANPKTKIKSIYKKNVDHVFDTCSNVVQDYNIISDWNCQQIPYLQLVNHHSVTRFFN